MIHPEMIPYELRERFFRRAVPVREVTQAVYHGSPLDGMVDIMRAERLYPQGHAELPDDEFLSVSINDNVLRLFADGEPHLTGFCSTPKLRVAHLDTFHNAVATWRGGCRTVEDIEVKWAERLGYIDRRYEPDMGGSDLRQLLRSRECHGLAFNYLKWCQHMQFHTGAWNDEAEIALTEHGCDEVWRNLYTLYVGGEEYDNLHEGWRAVAKCAIQKGCLTAREARPLIKRMDEIVEENQRFNEIQQLNERHVA